MYALACQLRVRPRVRVTVNVRLDTPAPQVYANLLHVAQVSLTVITIWPMGARRISAPTPITVEAVRLCVLQDICARAALAKRPHPLRVPLILIVHPAITVPLVIALRKRLMATPVLAPMSAYPGSVWKAIVATVRAVERVIPAGLRER